MGRCRNGVCSFGRATVVRPVLSRHALEQRICIKAQGAGVTGQALRLCPPCGFSHGGLIIALGGGSWRKRSRDERAAAPWTSLSKGWPSACGQSRQATRPISCDKARCLFRGRTERSCREDSPPTYEARKVTFSEAPRLSVRRGLSRRTKVLFGQRPRASRASQDGRKAGLPSWRAKGLLSGAYRQKDG